jgi:hypothetical protein
VNLKVSAENAERQGDQNDSFPDGFLQREKGTDNRAYGL